MTHTLPENVLRDLLRSARKCYHNEIYGNMITGSDIPEMTLSEKITEYIDKNIPDEYRNMKIEVEQYE